MILHVDMDAFYASVEQRDQPELVGKPVVVGGDPQRRGVVAAASYAARKFGVHSAMPSSTARRLCPEAIFLPSRIGHYAEVSRAIRKVFEEFTPLVEPLSLDEAFLDVTGSERLFGDAATIGRAVQARIAEQVQLPASVGVAPNKFLAKLASDLEKPNGFVVVEEENVQAFLDPLEVGRLWGVGKVSNQVLERLGVRTIGQLRQLGKDLLREQFGAMGEQLARLAEGVDLRQVVPDAEAKSISHETTFAKDLTDTESLRCWLLELTEQVARRVRRHGFRGRKVTLKVRFADFRTVTRSMTLPVATDVTEELRQAADGLFMEKIGGNHPPVRLLGMGVSGFDESGVAQQMLFDGEEHERQRRLDEVTDALWERGGSASVRRAAGWLRSAKEKQKGDGGGPNRDME